MAKDFPIPPFLSRAFGDAVLRFRPDDRWNPEAPDEKMIDVNGTLCSISEVCKLVRGYSDRLSDNAIYGALYNQMMNNDLKEKLSCDGTYGNAADCMLEMIELRAAEYLQRRGLSPVRR